MEIPTDGKRCWTIKLDRGTTSQLLGQLLFRRKETTHVCQDKEKRRHSCAVGLNVNWPSHDENSMESPPKLIKELIQPSPLHTYSKATKILFWKTLYPHVHCSIIYNSQGVNQPTINGWSDQENVLFTYTVLFTIKRGNPAICVTTWVELESIMLRETVRQRKMKYCWCHAYVN